MKKQIRVGNIIITKHLASFGDAIINFIYSCAWTYIHNKPQGFKVSSLKLARAVSITRLRSALPSRLTIHDLANIYEALTAYVFLNRCMTIEEMVQTLLLRWKELNNKDDADIHSLAYLLKEICKKIQVEL